MGFLLHISVEDIIYVTVQVLKHWVPCKNKQKCLWCVYGVGILCISTEISYSYVSQVNLSGLKDLVLTVKQCSHYDTV